MKLTEYLDTYKCHYRVVYHKPAYTAEQLAHREGADEKQVAKSVVVEAEGQFYLCVLPADRMIDFVSLQEHLHAKEVHLAEEMQIAKLFADSEIGAEAPFGKLYNLPTLMDKKLLRDREIVFSAGSHEASIHMPLEEYLRLAGPEIFSFSYPQWTPPMLNLYLDPFAGEHPDGENLR